MVLREASDDTEKQTLVLGGKGTEGDKGRKGHRLGRDRFRQQLYSMGSATSVSDSGDPYWRDNPQTSALGGRDVYSSSALGHLPSPFTGRPEYVLAESRSPAELQAPGLLPNPHGPTLQPSGFSVSRDPVYERQPLAMPYGLPSGDGRVASSLWPAKTTPGPEFPEATFHQKFSHLDFNADRDRRWPSSSFSYRMEALDQPPMPLPGSFPGKPFTLLIFDWDDTLMCSSAINANEFLPHQYNQLESLVEQVLLAAMRLGETCIVTNADEMWVTESARRYMPRVLPILSRMSVVSARRRFVRLVAMTEEAEVSNVNRDRQFEIVRDGEFAEAKKVLSTADMSWRHSALGQNFLFFIAARRRRGSELLAKQCVAMGVDLEEEDVHGQTPLFYAAARGNMVVVKFLLNLGFEINWRDNARKTALFFAIEKGHLEVADYLIERAASLWVRSNKVTPHSMLKKLGRKPPERKRKLASPTPSCICPSAATRSRFSQWEWKYDEDEPQIDRKEDNVLVETPQYFVCSTVTDCAKRLRRSELEFAGDHAHLHQDTTWYPQVTTQQAAALVNVRMDDEKEHLKVIEQLASGCRPSAFTLPAVSTQSKTVAGYIHASIVDTTLTISQCKVDRPHQGRGLGGLLIQAAEKRARNLEASISRVKLSVLETNDSARKCYAKERTWPGDVFAWKREAFRQVLSSWQANALASGGMHLIVLGDSVVEMEAAHTSSVGLVSPTAVKTVKFKEVPTVEELLEQLTMLNQELASIVADDRSGYRSLATRLSGFGAASPTNRLPDTAYGTMSMSPYSYLGVPLSVP
ncbi:hypothetical protein AK812_SmicGene40568 [Symbiodinium microadriaticum]|uniref:N-acetyltransferase domain-containing protein n=1 Tax=Symbiodinium microadriaticum TaxID=2951 RepID=A0A1Q9C8A4_SYMMI|nr:hypothetical protein AK812_SmicGene40568 [Symbiodinium microadriaticum]